MGGLCTNRSPAIASDFTVCMQSSVLTTIVGAGRHVIKFGKLFGVVRYSIFRGIIPNGIIGFMRGAGGAARSVDTEREPRTT